MNGNVYKPTATQSEQLLSEMRDQARDFGMFLVGSAVAYSCGMFYAMNQRELPEEAELLPRPVPLADIATRSPAGVAEPGRDDVVSVSRNEAITADIGWNGRVSEPSPARRLDPFPLPLDSGATLQLSRDPDGIGRLSFPALGRVRSAAAGLGEALFVLEPPSHSPKRWAASVLSSRLTNTCSDSRFGRKCGSWFAE